MLKWSEEIKQLANITQTQPHAAYYAYTHGLSSCWTFLPRNIPDIAGLLEPLKEAIQNHLIPALTGCPPCSSVERDLLALPVSMGSMGIINPASMSQCVFEGSVRETSPLVDAIATQDKTKKWKFSKLWKSRCQYSNPIINIRCYNSRVFTTTYLPAEALC